MADRAGYLDQGSKAKPQTTQTTGNGVPFWGDAPEVYDSVTLGGIVLPGICVVKGKGYEMKARHNKPPGTHGESIVHLGNEPAQWNIHILMNTVEHLRAFEALAPLFKPPYKPPPKALPTQQYATPATTLNLPYGLGAVGQFEPTAANAPKPGFATGAPTKDKSKPSFITIQHPMLTLFRISHCVIMDVTIPEQVQEKGMWEARITCREYVLSGSKKATAGKPENGVDKGRSSAFDKELNRSANSPSQTSSGPDRS